MRAEIPLLATTEYHTLCSAIWKKWLNINNVANLNTHNLEASTIIVTIVLPAPLNKPTVLLYIAFVQHQNAIIERKSEARGITFASEEKIFTIAVETMLLDNIKPAIKRNMTPMSLDFL